MDNVFVERLWRSLKYEEVYPSAYANLREARAGLARYLAFYSRERPHQALTYRTPAQVCFQSAATASTGSTMSSSGSELRVAATHMKEGAHA